MVKFVLNGSHFENPKWQPCWYLRNLKQCFSNLIFTMVLDLRKYRIDNNDTDKDIIDDNSNKWFKYIASQNFKFKD